MVRSLVGAVMAVGYGRRDLVWLEMVSTHPVRSPAIKVAAPRGLTLEEVVYPGDADMAARAEETRARRQQSDLDEAKIGPQSQKPPSPGTGKPRPPEPKLTKGQIDR